MRHELSTQVGADGVLNLSVPMSLANANKRVRVVVETVRPAMTREEWLAFLERTSGSITDDSFERPPQGEFEERDPL